MDDLTKILYFIIGTFIFSIFFVPITIEMGVELPEGFNSSNGTYIQPSNVNIKLTAPIYFYGFSIIKDKIIATVEYLDELGY